MPETRLYRNLPELLLLPLTLFVLLSLSCEKDDICVDGNTPLLGISFLDIVDSTTAKTVTGFRAIPLGQTDPPETYPDRSDLSEASIPLRVDRDTTIYLFIR